MGWPHLIHFADFRTRVVNVGENHRRPAKDAVFQRDALIDMALFCILHLLPILASDQ